MSENSESPSVSRRKFLAVAGSIAAAKSLALENRSAVALALAPSPTPYFVTIDVTQDPIAYTISQPTPGKNAYHLNVSPSDIVNFTVNSSGASQKHSVAIFFPNDSPFVDNKGRPLYEFLWTETEEGSNALNVDPDGKGAYEYRVIVFDKSNGKIHRDDPKIIVGSGGKLPDAGAKLAEQRKNLEQIAKLCPQQKDEIEKIAGKLREVQVQIDESD